MGNNLLIWKVPWLEQGLSVPHTVVLPIELYLPKGLKKK